MIRFLILKAFCSLPLENHKMEVRKMKKKGTTGILSVFLALVLVSGTVI